MLVNNSWQSSGNITHETGSDTWTAENIDPNSISGNVFVQLYYLKENSEFAIDSIEVVPVKASDNSETESSDSDSSDSSNSKTDTDSNTDKNGTSSDSSSIGEDSAVSSEAEKTNSSTSSIAQQESNNEAVENAVDRCSGSRKNSDSASSDSNPSTGSAAEPIRIIITALCAAEILWSLFVIIFNRVHKKED